MSDAGGADDVLSKADAFIRRRRAQLGNADIDAHVGVVLPDDDIPVLTEIVADFNLEANGKDIGAEVARELEAWLDENLPQAVVHVLDGVTDKLIQQIHASARAELVPRLQNALRPRRDGKEE